VPEGIHALVVSVKDLQRHGGPEYIYRLSITPCDHPSFDLTLLQDRLNVPQGGVGIVRVRANRNCYNGPIKLSIPALPHGVVFAGDEIPAGGTEALMSFLVPATVSPGPVLTKVIGTSTDPKPVIRRPALLAETPVTKQQPWPRGELAVAVIESAPVRIAWDAPDATPACR
jgi:hypothetical protein